MESKRFVRKGRGTHVRSSILLGVHSGNSRCAESAALAGSRSQCWVLATVFSILMLPVLAVLELFTFGPHSWTTISSPPFSSFDFTAGISVATI